MESPINSGSSDPNQANSDVTDAMIFNNTQRKTVLILQEVCTFPATDTLQNDKCDICFEGFDNLLHKPIKLPCGHVFGTACITTWSQIIAWPTHPWCPMCREPYLTCCQTLRIATLFFSEQIRGMLNVVSEKLQQITEVETLEELDTVTEECYNTIDLHIAQLVEDHKIPSERLRLVEAFRLVYSIRLGGEGLEDQRLALKSHMTNYQVLLNSVGLSERYGH
ncbi:MAG: hypothetical protein Q9226_005385 [Calogaya cf. arnoldii]